MPQALPIDVLVPEVVAAFPYTWSASGTAPDETAFTTFLRTLNHGTSPDGTTISGCFAGHCDWRLPTNAELQTILLDPFPCGTTPCIDPIFDPTQSLLYWFRLLLTPTFRTSCGS